MPLQPKSMKVLSPPGALFLPLAFRFAVSFGLVVLQLALPVDVVHPPVGENLYLAVLLILFLECIWEIGQSLVRTGQAFTTPSLPWIRFNLLLDLTLVTLLVSFQGVDQERFATAYIIPVLASAFYLRIPGILSIGVLASCFHITSVLCFTFGVLPAFGRSGPSPDMEPSSLAFILGFAVIQILAATLVVIPIRKHLETLRTTLRQSEATVDELSALYQRVYESMFSGIITIDLQGRITSANPAAESILQRAFQSGSPFEDLGLADLTSGEPLKKEHRFERSFTTVDGTLRIIGGNVAPIRDRGGIQTGHLLLFQDLTDIKALEERTKLSERLATVGELSSELAHELRNPVASILGCVQILQQGEHPAALTNRVLKILQRESERVSAIVSDFLDFSRPRPVKIQSLWFPNLLDEIRASWETDPRNEGLELVPDQPPEIWIKGDPICVHQVFTNLLSNARKALVGRAAPVIRIRFLKSTKGLEVEVEDNGCGMTPEQLHTIFLPFSSGFREGTGLGMSLVFQFVQRMDWDIRIESTLGTGTTIHLMLPLGKEPDLPGMDT
jgi:two-component system sensor histidine kinase PilS (NtrC family)